MTQKFLAARLSERVRIEQPVHADDGQGGIVPAWELVAEVWAEITPLLPRQNQAIDQIQDTRLRCIMREQVAINTSYRLIWKNNPYAIYWVSPSINTSDYNELWIKTKN